ncbi:MAG TPA: DUF4810 domain-containing protein [Cellvibrionaceae bacterium]
MNGINRIPKPFLLAKGRLLFAPFFVLLFLSGCATQPSLYRWGDYDSQVYEHFKNTGSIEQQIAALEKTLSTGNQTQNPAPGIHAHLGLLYAKSGQENLMRKHWELEKALYPESAAYLDFLMYRNAKKPQGAQK